MTDAGNDAFNLEKVTTTLSQSRTPDGKILIRQYAEGYKELNKLFGCFGTVFGFVTSDIDSKLSILEQHLEGENAAKYESVQSMTEFEVAEDITVSKTKLPSGSRTLLRLHRALRFIVLLLGKIVEVKSDEYLGSHASEVYNISLAQFHTWVVRKMVSMALRMLSTKSWMLQKISSTMSEDECVKALQDVIAIIQPIYDIVEDVYTQKDLHTLP